MNGYEKPFYESRKFQLMMGLIIAAILKQMGVPVPDEIFWAGLAGIMGVAATDFGKENKVKAEVVSNLKEDVKDLEAEIEDDYKRIDSLTGERDQARSEVLSIAGEAVVDQVPPHELPSKTPTQWEREYLDYFEERINYQKGKLAMYPDTRFGFDELLKVAEHSLVVAKAMVESVKAGRSEPYSLGELGYRILGQKPPWEK